MPRWEADGKSRLELAALELFLETGYDSTTVAGIARRAGLTERSFYRHFTDKREVLFSGTELLTDHLLAHITSVPADVLPYEALITAITTADQVFFPKDFVRRRVDAIARSPALAERELIKLARLSDAFIAALRGRGVVERPARLIADLGMSVFRLAAESWLTTERPFAELVREAVDDQRRAAGLDAPRAS